MTVHSRRTADMLARAREALAEGEPESALQILQTRPQPKGAEAELLRARCHTLIAEDFDAALSALVRAGEAGADPGEVRALYGMLVTGSLSRPTHARLLGWLSEALDDPDLSVTLSRLHMRGRHPDKAEAAARRALSIEPAHEGAHRALFMAVMASDRPERGVDVVRDALRTCPTYPRFPAIKALFSGLPRAEMRDLVAEMTEAWPGAGIALLSGQPSTRRSPRPKANGAYRAAVRGDLEDARARARAHLEARAGQVLTTQDETIMDVLPLIPGPSTRSRPLIEDDYSEVLRSAPSQNGVTMLVFSDLAHQQIYQAEVLDAFAAATGAATVILRDYGYELFIGGVGALAEDRTGTLRALERELVALDTTQLLVVGVSSGGFSAASYGRELGCERIVGLSVSTNIGRFLRGDDRRARMLISKLARSFPPEELDLTLKLPTIPHKAPMELYFGAQNDVDRAHARDLEGQEGVTLRPVSGLARHQVLPSMLIDGTFQRWIEDPGRDDM